MMFGCESWAAACASRLESPDRAWVLRHALLANDLQARADLIAPAWLCKHAHAPLAQFPQHLVAGNLRPLGGDSTVERHLAAVEMTAARRIEIRRLRRVRRIELGLDLVQLGGELRKPLENSSTCGFSPSSLRMRNSRAHQLEGVPPRQQSGPGEVADKFRRYALPRMPAMP